MNLTLERNICTCHPETCGCDPYNLLLDGVVIARVYNPEGAIKLIQAVTTLSQ